MKFKKLGKVGLLIALAASLVACGGNKANNETANEGSNAGENKPAAEASADLGTINVISREQGSGTRSAFTELTGVLEKDGENEVDKTYEEASVQSSTDAVLTTVQNDIAGIGYISLGSLNDTVKAVKVDGTEATPENIKSGEYKLARPFNIAYKAEIDEKTQDFIKFIMSEEGQKIASEEGYIGEDNAEAYEPIDNDAHIAIAGSTSVTPLMEKLVEAYKALNPKFEADIQSNGSSAGMTAAIEKTAQIGMASRELKEEEAAEVESLVIARDGIAVVVNKDNTVEDLTMENLKEIFTGEVTEWSEFIK